MREMKADRAAEKRVRDAPEYYVIREHSVLIAARKNIATVVP